MPDGFRMRAEQHLVNENRRLASSLLSGLPILECFTAEHPTRGVAELAEELALSRPTAHRYACTLAALGLLEQRLPSRRYQLAEKAANFGGALLDSMPLRNKAAKHLRELRDEVGYTVGLGTLAGAEIVYLAQVRGHRKGQWAIDDKLGPGVRLPAFRSALGKALLAQLPRAEQARLLASLDLTAGGSHAATTERRLRAELQRVRGQPQGLAVSDEELLVGMRAIAAPIRDEHGKPVGAIDVSVPAAAFTRAQLVAKLGPLVAEKAVLISTLSSEL